MLISCNWLKNYVTVPDDITAFVHDLTMAGLNIETWETTGLDEERIVVGRVLEVEKHPNADKLSVCQVEVATGDVKNIVCGAPNVAAGQFVPVALTGASLPNGLKIKKSKIRGIHSEGMICSDIELGLGNDAAGIMVLEGEYELGTKIRDFLMPSDTILELEVTPNRPDLLSHLGVAREVAAIYKTTLNIPQVPKIPDNVTQPTFGLDIEDPADCPRYIGRVIKNVTVGPSPGWLISALDSVGLNSINNIVDVTNYVMLETGQPLHAFDLRTLNGPRIIVRRAYQDEAITALDEENYQLTPDDLVIADEKQPVALAGIIGGLDTAVTERTTDILLECAAFHPTVVRKTRKKLNILTDASYRFERGSDREICRYASDRVTALLQEIAGGTPGELIDKYEQLWEQQVIDLRTETTRKLLGVSINAQESARLLEPIEFTSTVVGDDRLQVAVPPFRGDIVEEADLVEELARLYGYERIGTGWDYRCTAHASFNRFDEFTEALLDHLAGRGFTEVLTTSFTDGTEADLFGWPAGDPRREYLAVRNPMVAAQRYMRTSLLPGMLDVVRRNLDQGLKRITICQAGKIFLGKGEGRGLPEERQQLVLVMTRPETDHFWLNVNKPMDLFDIKREIEVVARAFKIDIWHDFCYDFDGISGSFSYSVKDDVIIEGGIAGAEISAKYDFEQPVWYAVLDLERLYKARLATPRSKPLAEYPVSKRDLSLLAKESVRYEQIEKALVKNSRGLLESARLFDIYTGDAIPAGSTAYGIRLQFRSKERTLTDEEIDNVIDKILTKLKNDLDVELRS